MAIMPIIQWLQHNSIVLMFGVFTLMLVTTYWPGRRDRFAEQGERRIDDRP